MSCRTIQNDSKMIIKLNQYLFFDSDPHEWEIYQRTVVRFSLMCPIKCTLRSVKHTPGAKAVRLRLRIIKFLTDLESVHLGLSLDLKSRVSPGFCPAAAPLLQTTHFGRWCSAGASQI